MKIKKNRTIILIACISLICCAFLSYGNGVVSYASVYFGNNLKLYPIYKVDTQKPQVAITFDAGWGADKTEQIMEVCDKYGIKATFFLVGIWIEEYENLTKLIAEKNFEIGSHSYNHPDLTKLALQDMQTELIKTNALIKEVVGFEPKLFRAPFGAYNNDVISAVNKLNMSCIQWDVDTLDWKGYGPQQVLARVNSKIDNGSIILCHNNAEHVVENTELILKTLIAKGYQFVKVSELICDVKEIKIGIGKL